MSYYIASSIAIISLFVGYSLQWGLLPSLSASYYELKKKGLGVVFFFVMIAFPLPLAMAQETLFMGLAVGSLWFVGVSAAYDDAKIINRVHFASAGNAVIFSMLDIWVNQNNGIMVLAFVSITILIVLTGLVFPWVKRRQVMLIELAALIVNYVSLIRLTALEP